MKQIFLNIKKGDIELEDIPAPTLKPGGVLVKNHFSLISSGTERQIINLGKKSLIEKAKERPDQVQQVINKIKTDGIVSALKAVRVRLEDSLSLGYSSSGEIIEVASDVQDFKVGDLVACAGQNYASHGEIIFVPQNLCQKIPEGVSLESASFVTLGAIALQGIRRAKLTLGETVAVIGLGLIGQLTVQILKAYGFLVVGFDPKEKMVKIAETSGMDFGQVLGKGDIQNSISKFTKGRGVDAVIITASTKSDEPLETAGKILRDKGRVSVVGDVGLLIPRKPYYEKELDFFISRSYGPGRYDKEYEERGKDYPIGYVRWTEKRNMEEFLRLCSKDLIHPERFINQIFEIEKYEEAYNLISNPNLDSLAILFSYKISQEIKRTIFIDKEKEFKIKNDFLNVGLIGTGNFAKSTILPILRGIEGINLRSVASADGKEAKKIAQDFQSNYATTDYQKILDDKEIDLVIVATRHNLHAKIASEALNRNKNIHIEKPLALNEKELKLVIKAAKASQGRLMVGFNRRFSPAIFQIKEFFGKNSHPFFIQVRVNAGSLPKDHWTRDLIEGGGRIIGEVCHFVDLVCYLADSPVKKVFTTSLPKEKSSEDDILTLLSLDNGSQASIIYTTQAPPSLPKEYIEIIGGEKTVQIQNFKSWTFFSRTSKKTKNLFLNQDKGHKNEFLAFIDAIKNGKPSPISIPEIFNSTLATFKILESLREGVQKEVSFNGI
jgi:predicted dehydrogenase/threonine dehydrogenase-like Zn-dependent dehydrogenase